MVVEHDEDTIRRADHVIDIGPSAGKRAAASSWPRAHPADIMAAADSQTGRYLLHAMRHPYQARRAVHGVADAAAIPTEAASADAAQRKTQKRTKKQIAADARPPPWPPTAPP